MIGLKTPTNSDALNNGSTNLRQVDPFQDVESYFESTTYVLKGTYDVISCWEVSISEREYIPDEDNHKFEITEELTFGNNWVLDRKCKKVLLQKTMKKT